VQDRIRRLLEVVPSRTEQHQNRPPIGSGIQIRNSTGESAVVNGAQVEGMEHQRVEEKIDESGKRRMMKGVKLIAKALEDVERCTRKKGGGRVSFYDCNLCMSVAKDPVLTCCGHMFCWPCFYHLPYAYGNAKECPVCEGEVIETNITPIYGNSSGTFDSDVASSMVPPRPAASRINSFRYYF